MSVGGKSFSSNLARGKRSEIGLYDDPSPDGFPYFDRGMISLASTLSGNYLPKVAVTKFLLFLNF